MDVILDYPWLLTGAYFVIAWITWATVGFFDKGNTWATDLVVVTGLLWPLTLLCLFISVVAGGLLTLFDACPPIGRFFELVGLLFNPYRMGKEIEWAVEKRREKKEKEENEKKARIPVPDPNSFYRPWEKSEKPKDGDKSVSDKTTQKRHKTDKNQKKRR